MANSRIKKNGIKNHRHFEEVCMDPEETKEVQERRIEYFRRKGDQQFTKNGRGLEITNDLVLQARAKSLGKQSQWTRRRRCERNV